MTKYSYGICIGASTISIVKLSKNDDKIDIVKSYYINHEGSPKNKLKDLLKKLNIDNENVIVTGRKFRHLLNAETISEPEAVELAYRYLKLENKFRAIASLGGENFIVYCINEKGSLTNIITGNKCASGTGEFFLQQIGRMNLSLDEAMDYPKSNNPYIVSGRCSVFCKSDCTHALNKGIPKSSVVSGLSKMIADKVIELLAKQNSKDVLLIGGVTQNSNVVEYIKEEYPSSYIPEEAIYFEALGAALKAFEINVDINDDIFKEHFHSYSKLPPLKDFSSKVKFHTIEKSLAKSGDRCIIGLDVGSTTTKAVVLRVEDNSVLASVYLRTNGNPIQASIECYKELKNQIKCDINIIGLGTTGSGRHIAALFSMTNGVINEIIAHAVAAAYFDKDVDTIFEIGGQDAKYTYLINGIASDYAMNEACSAGTGSFLEEAAKESLGIYFKEIGDIAIKSENPVNFNDQCAAFISSDIKNASHEGVAKDDIIAGLVYSICMNYNNRVKGNRQVGKKVFMQGGVCYNKAVPLAMAALIDKEIVVPPEPGLMGAFGVALEIKNRIENKLYKEKKFDFDELINRHFEYKKEFSCAGGAEKCDRKCGISIIEVEGEKFPFGGACSKYYNLRNNLKINQNDYDFVAIRQKLVFEKYLHKFENTKGKKVGISKSFMTNTLYPLYYNFFSYLGYEVVLADEVNKDGIDKIRSAFCYPVEIAYGFFQNLIEKKVDYIFMPHITQMHRTDYQHNKLCVFVQGEIYYLKSAFGDIELPELITPVIDFTNSYEQVQKTFLEVGKQLGTKNSDTKDAFVFAYNELQKMYSEFKEIGSRVIENIEREDKFGIVLFGRSYNAFASEANMSIPKKIASKGVVVIPHDFIPSNNYASFENMYWFSGQQILRSARFVKNHDKLFGVFITNFSCGPDSFIIPYFRKILGNKPSLTLELDSHSADVGIDTRIDAAFDIFNNYLELKQNFVFETQTDKKYLDFYSDKNEFGIIDSNGNKFKLNSSEVEVLVPSMGQFGTIAFQSVFRSIGINSKGLPIPTFKTLQHGRSMASCKECLPFILTTGSLIEYIQDISPDKKVLFFMPYGYGPCRQGQYYVMLKEVIKELALENVGVLTMNEEESFEDLGKDFFRRGWIALLISDSMTDIYNALHTLAMDIDNAKEIFFKEWDKIVVKIEQGNEDELMKQLENSSNVLQEIPLKDKLENAKIISIVGEIYVRREEFSQGDLIDTLIKNGFVVKIAPITEYVYYSNYLLLNKNHGNQISLKERFLLKIKDSVQRKLERNIKKTLAKSGLIKFEMIDIEKTIQYGKSLLSEELAGESILTIGLSLREIIDDSCGVISIGPFNCMPSRLSESILSKEMTLSFKKENNFFNKNYDYELSDLPFLYVETDGNAFPQITQSKLELFMMQANKVHHELMSKNKHEIDRS